MFPTYQKIHRLTCYVTSLTRRSTDRHVMWRLPMSTEVKRLTLVAIVTRETVTWSSNRVAMTVILTLAIKRCKNKQKYCNLFLLKYFAKSRWNEQFPPVVKCKVVRKHSVVDQDHKPTLEPMVIMQQYYLILSFIEIHLVQSKNNGQKSPFHLFRDERIMDLLDHPTYH